MKKEPWVLVANGFHKNGGMEKANLALAQYLLDEGHETHLVSYSVDQQLSEHPMVRLNLVRQPLRSYMLAEPLIGMRGRAIIKRVKAAHPNLRVITNGGNCQTDDLNWAHYVHGATPFSDRESPQWFRAKNRIARELGRRAERRAFQAARVVIANSDMTRRDLIEKLGVGAEKIRTVYLGTNCEWTPPTFAERNSAKKSFSKAITSPIVIFVGALGLDNRKGFDTLFAAWKLLCNLKTWDAHLIVAGSGNGLTRWQGRTAQAGLDNRITFLGFTCKIAELLAAADLLVSPARYEPYGLNVQEAICRGVPAIVSESAGIAERYPPDLQPTLLPASSEASRLMDLLILWRSNMDQWHRRFEPLGRLLRNNTWRDMARSIVAHSGQISLVDPHKRMSQPTSHGSH